MSSTSLRYGSGRKFLLCAPVFLFAIGSAVAQTVYSFNAVGYIDSQLAAGSNLVANPFFSTNNSISNLFRAVPSGSSFLTWNNASQSFSFTNHYTGANGWTYPAQELLLPSGGFLYVPSAAQITFAGEVWAPNACINFSSGQTFSVFPHQCCCFCLIGPCPPGFPEGSSVARWNRLAQAYTVYLFVGGNWYDAEFNQVDQPAIPPDEAALFQSPAAFSARLLGNLPTSPVACGNSVPLVNPLRSGSNFLFQFWTSSPLSYSVKRRFAFNTNSLYDNSWQWVAFDKPADAGWVTVTDTNVMTASSSAYYQVDVPWIVLQNAARSGTNFSFQFCAQSNATYLIERKFTLDAPAWQTLFTTNGAGLITVIDTRATNRSGYYRLRRE